MDDFTSPTGINWQGNTGVVEYGGGDKSQVVLFYNKAQHNPAKSVEAGRPIYDDVTMVRIHPPGERLNIVDCPATIQHRRRWPMQWQQYQQQVEQVPEGTPIDMLYPEQPSIGAMLKAGGVHTIEQCSELSANAIENIGMGAQTYVNTAVNYLKMSNKGVKASEYRKDIEQRDQQIKMLERQVSQLKQQLDQVIDNRINNNVSPDVIQAAIAQALGRPQHMPATHFDPAMAQLNATHGSKTGPQPGQGRIVKRQRASLRA